MNKLNSDLLYKKLKVTKLAALREYGNQVGLSNSTSLKKDELINEIFDILTGKREPVKRTKGRPSNQNHLLGSINDLLKECSGTLTFSEGENPYIVDESKGENGTQNKNTTYKEGVLELQEEGSYAFLRVENCSESNKDIYVANSQIRRFGLKMGDKVCGLTKSNYQDKFDAMYQITSINGVDAEQYSTRPQFENLVPIYPNQKLNLESPGTSSNLAIRCIDVVAPIGLGQRGLIVSPPKSGKTTLLKNLANAIAKNYPQIKLIMLLIDERPEEVTDIKRSVNAIVISSTFDETPDHHIKTSQLALEHAKRLVENGEDCIILLDSLTRLARAYNLVMATSGRTLSGGLDTNALTLPKKFFGAARNIDGKGSLTIIATALVDTGSKMDDIIFEEFKGTGNMEIVLDRNLSERRIFPAIDLAKSSTRKDELLFNKEELECNLAVRKILATMDKQSAMELLLNSMLKTKNNKEFYNMIIKQMR